MRPEDGGAARGRGLAEPHETSSEFEGVAWGRRCGGGSKASEGGGGQGDRLLGCTMNQNSQGSHWREGKGRGQKGRHRWKRKRRGQRERAKESPWQETRRGGRHTSTREETQGSRRAAVHVEGNRRGP